MARRPLLLILALLIALLGTVSVGLYVSRADSRAQAREAQAHVLVAQKLIKSGTSIDTAQKQGLVKFADLPVRVVPANALTSTTDIAGETAVADIYPGIPLVADMFAQTAAATGDLTIPDGKMAMSVQLTDPERVAGFVVPGSEVAVFVTEQVKIHWVGTSEKVTTGPAGKDDQQDYVTQLVLQRVPVLAVGPTSLRTEASNNGKTASGQGGQQVSTAVLTLGVSQDEAQRLAHAAQTGDLYFGLLSNTSSLHPSRPLIGAGFLAQ